MSQENPLLLDVVTPEGTAFSGEISMLVAPGSEGELGILKGHIPLVAKLKNGTLRAKINGAEEKKMEIAGGFMEVKANKIIVLTDLKADGTAAESWF